MTLASAAIAPAYNPGSWGTFFMLTGSAAAALTGLFFVAFSMRVRELQLSRVLRTRAGYLLIWLIAIVVGSGFVVMPGQSDAVLAAEILIVSVIGVTYTLWSILRTPRRERPPISAGQAVRWLAMAATSLLSIGAGISLLAGHGGGLYLLAIAMLLGIALQVTAAWTLIVETGKHGRGQDIMAGQEHQAEPSAAGQLTAGDDRSRSVPEQFSGQPAAVASELRTEASERPACGQGLRSLWPVPPLAGRAILR